MEDIKRINASLSEEVAFLREKLAEAEQVLQAIREGSVDAVVVSDSRGDRVYTLKGADYTYRILIETMAEGAVILSPEGTVLYCNSRFAEMVQTPIENIVGVFVVNFVDIFERDRFAGILKQALAEDIHDEIRLHPGRGETLPVLLSLRFFASEEVQSICMVVADLTRQKQSEQKVTAYANELQKINTELSRRAEQLSRMTSELTLSEQRERRRLAKILHDHLQQLLVGAKMGLESLSWRVAAEHRPGVKQVSDLLQESLETSRSLTMELCPPVLYEGGLHQALAWLCRWMKEKHGLKVELQADFQAVPRSESMRVLLFEAVRELLFNVVKHAGIDSAQVELSRQDGKYLKIVVSDCGVGFDPKTLWQSADAMIEGFGLLSIRERVSFLGGRFEVTSLPGEGTVIALTAPLETGKATEPKPECVAAARPLDQAAPSDARKGGKRIRVMVVDDHTVMRKGLSTLLVQTDLEVVGEAANGEQAVDMARKLRPDVILMDISMPKMNGIEATRIIHSVFPEIRIIGLSMYEEADQAAAMFAAGASAYRSKSDQTDLLLAAIREEIE